MLEAFRRAGFAPASERLRIMAADVLRLTPTPYATPLPESEPKVRELLKEAAMSAVKESPRNWDGAKDALYRRIKGDAALLWELFAPYRAEAVQKLLTEAAAELREKERPRPVPPVERGAGQTRNDHQFQRARPSPHPTAGMGAIASVARASLLDSFRINGRPIGDATPEEAAQWAGSRERDARFVRMLIENLPHGVPIRRFRTGEEAQRIYEEAGHE